MLLETLNGEELKQISKSSGLDQESCLEELKNGRAILLKNRFRKIEPVVAGKKFKCKVNVNLGHNPESGDAAEEMKKMKTVLSLGADTIMDLSTGPGSAGTRKKLIAECPVPFGTVPVYSMVSGGNDLKNLSRSLVLESVEAQAAEGVDFMTIHAGLLRKHLKPASRRLIPIVSRGGSLLAGFMEMTGRENPFYEYFEELLKIFKKYEVTVSLGDGLRPGCIHDATDKAQLAELKTLGELQKRCFESGVRAIIEGPGHIPMNQIEKNVKLADKTCSGAPLYFLGPIVTDIAAGYDHISSGIGAAMAGLYGVSLLCAVGPSEHIGLPSSEDIRKAVVTYKIAAHSVNVARGFADERERDFLMSEARKNFDWERQFSLSADPETARKRYKELNSGEKDHCSMCGKDFCAMRKKTSIPAGGRA